MRSVRAAWAVVADLSKIVDALTGAVGELFGLSDCLGELAHVRGKVVEDPVGEGADWGVDVGDDEGEALHFGGYFYCSDRGGINLQTYVAGG